MRYGLDIKIRIIIYYLFNSIQFNSIQFISTIIHKNTYKYNIVEIAQRIFIHTQRKQYTRKNRR